uniref:Uncharacterized protein n=1 Tax=Candidatus Kentrum sp. DK TaxID=2126562 RepID=A0A450STF7_9GAMM|nr:MAG: hypothetical protein BECKDK2373C_GA0170839_105821 [Candidatus Kentron sp. DK]
MDGMLLPMNFRKTAIALQPTPNIRAGVPSSEEELHSDPNKRLPPGRFPMDHKATGTGDKNTFARFTKSRHPPVTEILALG